MRWLALVAALATSPASGLDAGGALPFPVQISPRFALTDQTGRAVTEADYAGKRVALFFGYAQCESICTVALPVIGQALDILGAEGADIVPLMITVDPERDTPQAMAATLPKYSPRLVGLTGSAEALAAARAVFQVEAKELARGPDGGAIIAHGSFIYLIGRDGQVRTLIPPILAPERIAELMRSYN